MSWRRFLTNWTIGSAAIVSVSVLAPMVSDAGTGASTRAIDTPPVPGMAGTDTSLPLTDSAVTVRGRGRFADLRITVNQTDNLTNQVISITWEGGAPTERSNRAFEANFLQIMQCWGDDDGAVPGNPGPTPEQCVFGAVMGTPEGLSSVAYPATQAVSRALGDPSWPANENSTGKLDPLSGSLWRPFRPIGGPEVVSFINTAYDPANPSGFWLNPYFDRITTNEVVASTTYADGRGQELFEVLTGVQSTGLGCGQRVQTLEDGTKKMPRCWLVIVPRGSAADEDMGTPYGDDPATFGVATSPLTDVAWADRISVELHFNPVESPCSIDADDRRMVGTDLAVGAVSSWQPVLCTVGDLPPFSYGPVGDPLARQLISNPAAGGPGMAVVTRPVEAPADSPLVYAPLTVSSIGIGFNVERLPAIGAVEEDPIAGTRIENLYLTPRLVAKLLTQSYTAQLDLYKVPPYEWLADNPYDLAADPDFLQFNPEFKLLRVTNHRNFGGLVLPQGTSDAAWLVWQWILADPEARAWLDGEADQWGMQVNPQYSTNPDLNPTGQAFDSVDRVSFPKSDPYCFQPGRRLNGVVPTPMCGTDWMPYSRNMNDSARATRTANDGARVGVNDFGTSPSLAWTAAGTQTLGSRAILSITDSPSAARFGVQMARLSRAGDNGSEREFIAADQASMATALAAMTPRNEPRVAEPALDSQPANAYPLTIATYAVAAPLTLDSDARHDFAEFVRYAVNTGQTSGLEWGQLPPGYVPLTASLKQQALDAAVEIETLEPAPTTTTTTSTTTTHAPPATSPSTTTVTAAPAMPAAPAPYYPPLLPSGGPPGAGPGGAGSGSPEPTPPATVPESTVAPSTPPTTTGESPGSATTLPPVGDEPIETGYSPAVLTPIMSLSQSRMAVPAIGVAGLGSALGALEITKRPRRTSADGGV